MDDPRLLEWLQVTEEAADPRPKDACERLEAARLRRTELQQGLEHDPPTSAPSAELTRRLRDAEERLATHAAALVRELGARLDSVRRQGQATGGYRPASARRPSFVSHDV